MQNTQCKMQNEINRDMPRDFVPSMATKSNKASILHFALPIFHFAFLPSIPWRLGGSNRFC
jgi:hypothetical protein